MSKRDFIQSLSLQLVTPLLRRRLTCPNLKDTIRQMIYEFVPHENRPEEEDPRDNFLQDNFTKRKRCRLCPASLDRKLC